MKELGTIEEEAAACRAAFVGVHAGAWVWCCHHERHCELLTEEPETRIAYILSSKDTREQPRRLREFRLVLGAIPEGLVAAWRQADAAMWQADAAWRQADAAGWQADAAREQAFVAWRQADAARRQANAAWVPELEAMHRAEYPDTAWDGKTIFGGDP